MRVHGFWDREPTLSLGCKRLRPPAAEGGGAIDLKSFIRAESGSRGRRVVPPEPAQGVDTHPGGTRWNPTADQIAALEAFYSGGMRTPNSEQIERITMELGRFGKIEGKNVFYWFQNHKARERQKQKRSNLGIFHVRQPSSPSPPSKLSLPITEWVEDIPKKKWRSFGATGNMECDSVEEVNLCFGEEDDRTLELFPLHPEGRR